MPLWEKIKKKMLAKREKLCYNKIVFPDLYAVMNTMNI